MEELIKTTIEKELQKATKEKREAVLSIPWMSIVKEIGEKYLLTKEEVEDIQRETGVTILGLRNQDSFFEKIEDIIVDKDVSNKVCNDIIEKILTVIALKINPSIKKTYEQTGINTSTIDPRFLDLPEKTKEAIILSGWRESLFYISNENKLNIEQAGLLEDIVVKTMKNEISPDNFKFEIISKTNIEKEKIDSIVENINKKIFEEIRRIMKGENKHQGNESVVEDIVPLPPYPIKTVVAEPVSGPTTTSYKTAESNESKRLQDILNSQIKEIGSEDIKNINFEVPKTAQNIVKDAPSSNISMSTSKPHDPYREVL
ncbi:MAG: hypothetical protein EOM85_01070 [Candidatus Moranbacteria bacterium]|nr:hypothetical protein [Candidatus Moranbacteria bacterium]